jgi:hypothetical protein
MGGGNIFIKDQSNVFLFPSLIMQYPDLVVSEMRAINNDAFYSMGIHMEYSNMVSGFYINQPINSLALSTGQGILSGATPLNNAYVYMLGMKMGGMDMGFGFIGASTSFENNTDPKGEESASYIGVLYGVSMGKLDAGLLIEIPSVESKNFPVADTEAEYGGFAMQANGRYHLLTRNGFNVSPVGNLSFGSTSIKDGPEYSLFGFALGLGFEKQINEENLFILGVEAGMLTTTTVFPGAGGADDTETSTTTYTLPGIYVGVESRIASWLVGRLGATQVNQKVTSESDPESPNDGSTTSSQFLTALGLGMEFGNFLIDFNFNEGLLFNGPNFISGNVSPFATTLSVTYNFGGGENE